MDAILSQQRQYSEMPTNTIRGEVNQQIESLLNAVSYLEENTDKLLPVINMANDAKTAGGIAPDVQLCVIADQLRALHRRICSCNEKLSQAQV